MSAGEINSTSPGLVGDLNTQSLGSQDILTTPASSLQGLNLEGQILAQYDYSQAERQFESTSREVINKINRLTRLIVRLDAGTKYPEIARTTDPNRRSAVNILANAGADGLIRVEQIKSDVFNQNGQDPFNIKQNYENGIWRLDSLLTSLDAAERNALRVIGGPENIPVAYEPFRPIINLNGFVDFLKGFQEWFFAPSQSPQQPPPSNQGDGRIRA